MTLGFSFHSQFFAAVRTSAGSIDWLYLPYRPRVSFGSRYQERLTNSVGALT
jgi:hypothetical protein